MDHIQTIMGLLRKIIRSITKPIRAKAHGAAGEKKVDSKLNPLIFGKVDHRQINNLILVDSNGKSHQIDHIEIRENGIFCIETKNYIGWIFGNEDSEKWTQTLYTGEKHQFFNPLKQNKSHCYQINKVLGGKYVVNSLVVMASNNADRINCPNVINISNLRSYIKGFDNGLRLSIEDMDYVYNKLLLARSNMSNQEHVQNIRNTQKELQQNICPRCGGTLNLRNGVNGRFYGCSNYPGCKFTKNV